MLTYPTNIVFLMGACLALAAPANAETNWSGYGELSGGGGPLVGSAREVGFCVTPPPNSVRILAGCPVYTLHISKTETLIEGGIHTNTTLASGFGIQLDTEGHYDHLTATHNWTGSGDSLTGYGFGVHLNQGNESYRAGAMLSAGNVANNWLMSVGPEGNLFFADTTLFAQAVYSRRIQSGDRVDLNSWYLHAGVRYFCRDNLMFEGGAGAGTAEQSGHPYSTISKSSANTVQFDLKAEYLFHDLPFSVFVRYWHAYGTLHNKDSYNPGAAENGNRIMLGVRFYFGQDSLIANDRNGPGMNDYNPWYGVNPFMREIFESSKGAPIAT